MDNSLVCRDFLRGRCTDALCALAHSARVDRPKCALFGRGQCTRGDTCWWSHDGDPQAPPSPAPPLPSIILQVRAAQDQRVVTAIAPLAGVRSCTVIRGTRRAAERLVLVNADEGFDAATLLTSIAAVPMLRIATPRAYAVDGESASAAEALDALVKTLREKAVESGSVRFRTHAFPRGTKRALEVTIAEEIEGRDAALVPATSGYSAIACFVDAGEGRFFWGVCGVNDAWAAFRADREPATVLCRSQRKLEELGGRMAGTITFAAAETGDSVKGSDSGDIDESIFSALGERGKRAADCTVGTKAIALDLGAAPGGWAATLSHSHSVVLAVDPADLSLEELSQRVIHVRLKAADAIEYLRSAGLQGRVTTITCDANVNAIAAAEWVMSAFDLLRVGGVAIMSAKNFAGGAARWREDVLKVEQIFLDGGFSRVQKMHLFSGGEQEMTIVCFKTDEEVT